MAQNSQRRSSRARDVMPLKDILKGAFDAGVQPQRNSRANLGISVRVPNGSLSASMGPSPRQGGSGTKNYMKWIHLSFIVMNSPSSMMFGFKLGMDHEFE